MPRPLHLLWKGSEGSPSEFPGSPGPAMGATPTWPLRPGSSSSELDTNEVPLVEDLLHSLTEEGCGFPRTLEGFSGALNEGEGGREGGEGGRKGGDGGRGGRETMEGGRREGGGREMMEGGRGEGGKGGGRREGGRGRERI